MTVTKLSGVGGKSGETMLVATTPNPSVTGSKAESSFMRVMVN